VDKAARTWDETGEVLLLEDAEPFDALMARCAYIAARTNGAGAERGMDAQSGIGMAEMGAAYSCTGHGDEQPVQRSHRMDYLTALERATPVIEAIAVTDYYDRRAQPPRSLSNALLPARPSRSLPQGEGSALDSKVYKKETQSKVEL
jgi:hypothetical protein